MKSPKNPSQMVLLAVDPGTKRVGLAIWNPQAQMSRPITHLARKTLKDDLAVLKRVLEEHKAEGIVIGIPYNLEGERTQSTANAEFWVETLEKNFGLPIFTIDEALSTKEAMKVLRQTKAKNKKDKVDSLAAALILEEFIRKANERPQPHSFSQETEE